MFARRFNYLWAMPMSYAGHNNSFNICHHVVPVVGLLGCALRNQWTQVAGLDRGQNTSEKAKSSKHFKFRSS